MKRMLHHLQYGLLKHVSRGSVSNRQGDTAQQALIDLSSAFFELSSAANHARSSDGDPLRRRLPCSNAGDRAIPGRTIEQPFKSFSP